jgi:hypothetical protein
VVNDRDTDNNRSYCYDSLGSKAAQLLSQGQKYSCCHCEGDGRSPVTEAGDFEAIAKRKSLIFINLSDYRPQNHYSRESQWPAGDSLL